MYLQIYETQYLSSVGQKYPILNKHFAIAIPLKWPPHVPSYACDNARGISLGSRHLKRMDS